MTDTEARLVLATRFARRDHLHGAWWPRTTDFVRELPALLDALPSVLRPVHGITVNRAEWPGAPLMFKALPTRSPVISWYGLPEADLAVLHCATQARLAIMVVAPSTPDDVAAVAMQLAAATGNDRTTAEVIELAELRVASHGSTAAVP